MASVVKQKSKKGLPLKKLINETVRYMPYTYERSRDVRLYSPKRSVDKEGNLVVECTAKSRRTRINTNPQKRRVKITALDRASKVSRAAGIKVECDCEDHCFTWEVALYRVGAADIVYSNGEKPIVKNASMVPLVCKHVLRLLMAIKAKGY
ncbi:hypothetical protein Illi2_00100 [Pseudomonas phage vB_PpuM-Illi-2]